MQRVLSSRNASIDKFGEGKNGFKKGEPQNGIPATTPGFEWFDAVQEELASVIEGAEIELDENQRNQLFGAINKINKESVSKHIAEDNPHQQYAKQEDFENIMTVQPGQCVLSFSGKPLKGTLPCYGGTVLIEDYPKYAEAVGTRYGGDGITTVGLPNLTDGSALLASGNLDNVGKTTSGDNKSHIHTAWSLEAGAHNHSTGQRYYTGATSNPSPNNMGTGGTLMYTDTQGSHSHTIGIGDSGGVNNLAAGMKILVCVVY